MRCHVVIVNWNGREDTLACIASLNAAQPAAEVLHVVDNGSEDGSVDALREAHPEVRVHAQERNLGFAAGANVGIRAALAEGATHLLLVNNDSRVDAGLFGAFADAVERHPEAGLYGGKIFADAARTRLWCCGVTLGWSPNLCRLRGHGRPDGPRFSREEEVPSLTGCGLLIAREVFDSIGLLDESYFVYVEDTEFCAKARKAGHRCRYVPGAILEHEGAGSTGGGYSPMRKYLSAHGAVRFLRRHGTLGLWSSWLVCDLLAFPFVLTLGVLSGRKDGVLAKGRGLWHGLLGRTADLRPLERERS